MFWHTTQALVDIRIYTYYNKKGIQKMPMTSKQMIKHLKNNGFEKISQNGSHIKMRNSRGITVIVPYHSKTLKRGMEQAILKQAKLL